LAVNAWPGFILVILYPIVEAIRREWTKPPIKIKIPTMPIQKLG
jgi:hypothetical protein